MERGQTVAKCIAENKEQLQEAFYWSFEQGNMTKFKMFLQDEIGRDLFMKFLENGLDRS